MQKEIEARRLDTWKTTARETLLDLGEFLSVENHSIALPGGRLIKDWPWIVTPDYVNVCVLTESGQFLMFRQTKYAVDGISLAPVGGYLKPGEDPTTGAQRELLEETGYSASDWTHRGPMS